MNTDGDGFLGAVMAAEGVEGMRSLINGPGGCRSRVQNLLRELIGEYRSEESGCCRSKFMSKQSRAPCTYLNHDDVVLGSAGKIEDGIRSVYESSRSDLVLIDTLGASVQVADRTSAAERSGYGDHVVISDEDLAGMTVSEGFDDTMVRILRHFALEHSEKVPGTVNVLGYNIGDSGWEFGKKEIASMLSDMGLEVVSFVGCGSTPDELVRSFGAEYNISVHPEFSRMTSVYYMEKHGIPCLDLPMPIGYDAIRKFADSVAEFTGRSSDVLKAKVDEEELHVCRVLNNNDRTVGGFRGYGMALEGPPSTVAPLMEWMFDLMSLVPVSVKTVHSRDVGDVPRFLESIGRSDALGAPVPPMGVAAYFGDGLTAGYLHDRDPTLSGVPVTMPYERNLSLVNRSVVGLYGCRYILDELVNGRSGFSCGQPTSAEYR